MYQKDTTFPAIYCFAPFRKRRNPWWSFFIMFIFTGLYNQKNKPMIPPQRKKEYNSSARIRWPLQGFIAILKWNLVIHLELGKFNRMSIHHFSPKMT